MPAAGVAATGAAAVGAAGAVAAGAAPPRSPSPVLRVRMIVPSDTFSPTCTLISPTTPPSGAGTSIVALSDSRVIRGCSALMASPGLTSTSMIGTFLKSPMSGTRTSTIPPWELAAAGGGDTLSMAGAADSAAAALSSNRTREPSETLSPTLTLSSLTVPATGEGTSMVALSDSSVISASSALMASPGLTRTSMTGTSLKLPMSGTLTSMI